MPCDAAGARRGLPAAVVTPVLEVGRVSCRFALGRGRFVRAVDDVSVDLQVGEAVALVGESGCGKSTLARLINRLAGLDAGHIRLDGREIGHDLGVVRLLCSRVLVMLGGQVVESGPAAALFADPLHPYTGALVDSIPNPARRGRLAPPEHDPSIVLPDRACRFAGRCSEASDRCWSERPALREVKPGRRVACHHRPVL